MRFAGPVVALVCLLSFPGPSHAESRFGTVLVGTPTAVPADATPGATVTFSVTASSSDAGAILAYSWDFGDGAPTPFLPTSQTITHAYAAIGHYTVTVAVREVGTNPLIVPTKTRNITIHRPIPALLPTASSSILLDSVNSKVWVANADQDTVSSMNLDGSNVQSFLVGKNPRTLAQAADKTIWVVSQQHPSISVLDCLTGALLHVISLPHGSLPYGLCMTPDGTAAYVSFQGSGGVSKISTTTRAVLATNPQPPSARGIAVSTDGRVFVTRFLSPQSNPLLSFLDPVFTTQNRGEVVELTASLGFVRTFALPLDPGVPGPDPDFGAVPAGSFAPANGSRGVPNYLTSVVINPDGRNAIVPSKKDNIQRGSKLPERDGRTPDAEVTYRAIISTLDLAGNTVPPGGRFDLDNSEMPQAACFSPFGDYLFIALQGNNRVLVRDIYANLTPVNGINGNFTGSNATAADGFSPQGLVLDPATSTLYVHNYMGRTVTIMDVSGILSRAATDIPVNIPTPGTVIPIVQPVDDALGATVLLGKQIFYNAADPRMSLNGYISCAGCHLDGGADMRVWDFTNRTEGFRNTVMLQGRGNGTGVKHGNAHWSANFDEIQDFENDMVKAFGGTGFSGITPPRGPMGATNSGLTVPLDALAAYVNSLTKVSRSPFRNADGTLTAAGEAGEEVFRAQNCVQCHSGREFTDSGTFTLAPPLVGPSIHNVGTQKLTSGNRLGNTLMGIDTPTLKGLWQTEPYFHDGSALTLEDVMNAPSNTTANAHGMAGLTTQQKLDLAQYMREIDELDAPPVGVQVNTVTLDSVATGRPYSLGKTDPLLLPFYPYVDRSYTIRTAIGGNVDLNNQILLRTMEDDKAIGLASLVTLTVTTATDVIVFFDSRATSLPTWLSSYTPTPADDVRISPGTAANGLLMNAYKKTFAPGTVVLGGTRAAGSVGALRQWFAILKPAALTFEEGPISQTEWVHPFDADGDGLRDEYEALSLLSPWIFNSATALLPDEDKVISGSMTAFEQQKAQEGGTAVAAARGGSDGLCGLIGFEYVLPLLLLRFSRRRRR